MKRYTKGFTLIELLVVIAIIGILASVVLVSLNTARLKARDARITSDVQQLRTQAEAGFNGTDYSATLVAGNAPTAACALGCVSGNGTVLTNTNAALLVADASNQTGKLFVVTAAAGPTAYAIFGALPSQPAGTYFCIDSAGRTAQAVATSQPTIACQ
ncbi:MAG: type pilus assembly protein PilA [Candidatus Parcubacteria bacterium]|jgi:prepilin-type N-terminal cleavage/methylation domain-containing protein|nr:type pilus assembly protein PilA [Candidatus Parcubacteria bacterium]